MIKKSYRIPLVPDQMLHLIPLGDIHYDTPECDRDRLVRLVEWCQNRKAKGELVRLFGLGDYLDGMSPSERHTIAASNLHDGSLTKIDQVHEGWMYKLADVFAPLRGDFLGLLTGHHVYHFLDPNGENYGTTTDQWLAKSLRCDYWGDGVMLFRLKFMKGLRLDLLAWHGAGGAQTPGGRVQKRIRVAEIAPTAHIVVSGHDNAKLAYPRSGLDYDHGAIKRYVVGSGSFQRGYLEGKLHAGYAEKMGLIPADLGVTIIAIQVEERNGKFRVDYHASV